MNLSDPEQLYSTICSSVVEYDCFGVFLSIMQHLLVIPSADLAGKQQVRYKYIILRCNACATHGCWPCVLGHPRIRNIDTVFTHVRG